MNWGHKIIIVFVLFAAGILTLVIKSINTKVDMVTNDYYAEELKYQQVIDGREQAALLSAPVKIGQTNSKIVVTFPPEMQGHRLTGQVLFYRASDSRQDVTVPLHTDLDGLVMISKQHFQKGSYQVKLQWEAAGKKYFQEDNISVQ